MSRSHAIHLALAASVCLTACKSSPVRVDAPQESVVHAAAPVPAGSQTLLLRRADGSLVDAVVDVAGRSIEVRNGRLVVPVDLWQQATASGTLLVTVPGFLPIKVPAAVGAGSTANDALTVRLEVSLVAAPKPDATTAAPASTAPAVEKPPTLDGFPVSQPVLTLPGGEAVRPDNGPWSLKDFTGTTSVLTQTATSVLAKTVVDLKTGTTVETRTGETPAQVVTRSTGSEIISNNGVSIVANHGGGVISDNGGGVKPVDDGNHDLQGSYVVAYPYAPFAPPQPKYQLLAPVIPGAPMVRTTAAGLREWLWPGTMQARAIAITGEPLSPWTLTDNDGRFAIPLPPAMPLLFFLETQPAPGVAVQAFHEYSLAFAPRGRVSLVGVDSSTSFNAIPFLYLTAYVDEQTASGNGALAALQNEVASLQAQVSSLQAAEGAQSQIDALNAQIAADNARIAQIQALLAYLAQLEKDLDANKNQLDVTSVFRFLKNPGATGILASPDLKTSYSGLEAESNANAFTPVSYPLVNLP